MPSIMVFHWFLLLFFFIFIIYIYNKKNSCRLWECVKPVRSFATERFCTFPWPEAKKKPRRVPLEAVGALWKSRTFSPTFPRTSMAVKGREKFHFGKSAISQSEKNLSRPLPVVDPDQNVLLNPTFQERVWKGCGKHMEKMTHPIYSDKNKERRCYTTLPFAFSTGFPYSRNEIFPL